MSKPFASVPTIFLSFLLAFTIAGVDGRTGAGTTADDPRVYRSYALYLLKFVQAYRANGVTVNAITVQNEPQNRTPSGYPGTDMPSAQEEKVIEDLGPMLRAAGLRTQIFACRSSSSSSRNGSSTPGTASS